MTTKRHRRLSKKRQKLVLKYRPMAYWFVGRNPKIVSEIGLSDANAYSLLFLCEAAQRWEPGRAAFSTFFVLYMRHAFSHLLTRLKRPVVVTMAKDDLAHTVSSGSTAGVQDPETIKRDDPTPEFERQEITNMIWGIVDLLHGTRHWKYVSARFPRFRDDTPTYDEIGKRFGTSKERTWQLINTGIRRIQDGIENKRPQFLQALGYIDSSESRQ